MFTKCTIHISFQYPVMFSEVLDNDIESTEVAIEAGISSLLMELFGGAILVDNVTLQYTQPITNAATSSTRLSDNE